MCGGDRLRHVARAHRRRPTHGVPRRVAAFGRLHLVRPENADLFDDDTSFQAALKSLDPGDASVFAAQLAGFGAWSGPGRQPVLAARFVDLAATEGVRACVECWSAADMLGVLVQIGAVPVPA